MDTQDFDELVRLLKARRVQFVCVNGHGETTMVEGWHDRVHALADAGFRLGIISNFARAFAPEELAAMARIAEIRISVDSHRPELLRQVRRHVALGNILVNMVGVSAKAAELGLPAPKYMWNCVVTDRVAGDLVDYVRFGLALGVRDFTLCNLVKFPDVEGAEPVNHVTTLDDEALEKFAGSLEEIRRKIRRFGGALHLESGLADTLHEEFERRALQAAERA
jgi:MoaA/NifB/PqqE/SkfB family radical SAM enzyme